MIKFDISELPQRAYLNFYKSDVVSIQITEKKPLSDNFILAPKLVCYMTLFKLMFKLNIVDFDLENHTFIFKSAHANRIEELFQLYKSVFDTHNQYLVVLFEDQDGHPEYRFEFNASRKQEIINEHKREFRQLDLLQIASGIIIDALSIRKFGGHIEVINRLNLLPVP